MLVVLTGLRKETMKYKQITDDEYNDFLTENNHHPFQSISWSMVKTTWQEQRYGFYIGDTLYAVAQILVKQLPMNYCMMYIPRGPVVDPEYPHEIGALVTELKKIGKENKAVFIKFDPEWILSTRQDAKLIPTKPKGIVIDYIRRQGVKWKGLTQNMSETLQPRIQAKIYKEDFETLKLSKSTRQTIRTAQNKGVTVQFGGLELLEPFATLMMKTADRKQISLRNEEYFRQILNSFKENAYITLATIDVDTRLETIKSALQNDPTNIKLREEYDLLLPEKGNKALPLAGTLTIISGKASENLYAGMDEKYKHYQAPLLTWYETVKNAIDLGATTHNLGGVEDEDAGALYNFKSKFRPRIESLIGEFNIPTHILYPVFNWLYENKKSHR